MVVTILKVFYKKQKTKIIYYRIYKNLWNDVFQHEVDEEILKVDVNNAELSVLLKTDISTWQACCTKAKICKGK